MFYTSLHSWIAQIRQDYQQFGDELLEKTFHRIFLLSMVATPVSAVHIVIFAGLAFDSETEQTWRLGIILYHSAMCLVFGSVALLTRPSLRQRWSLTAKRLFCRVSHGTLLAAGIVVTSIDQLVTPAVTPFLVACMVAGMLFIVNPLRALLIYSVLFIFYGVALSQVQPDNVILLSNLVNGLTACSIAAGLSWLLWLQNVSSLRQRNIILEQQHKLQLSNQQLEQLATRDELTGLANRRMLQMLVHEEQTMMRRHGSSACLLLLDLDHFKTINDQYGHPAGDQMLCQLAELLTRSVRGSDRIVRWGGEEFGILLRNTDVKQGLQVAENIRSAIGDYRAELMDQSGLKHDVRITVSIGLASLDASAADMLDQGYRAADVALYEAKTGGRNRVVSSWIHTEKRA